MRSTAATRTVSLAQARRIAVAAQQLAAPPNPDAAPAGRAQLRRLVDRLGLLQIDSVNVVARAHLLPVFARLGRYPFEVFEQAAWPSRSRDRLLVETWAHEASLVPLAVHPLLRWPRRHWSTAAAQRLAERHPGLPERVLAVIADSGPLSAGQVEKVLLGASAGRSGWWEWSETKRACEALFSAGLLGTAYRRGFERHYDLIERVLPPAVLAAPVPDRADAQRALVAIAARAHGIATAGDLADYFRMGVAEAKAAAVDLVDDGILEPVLVPGWRDPAYLHREARVPRRVAGRALLCPFDPLIWTRPRTERLFGVHYRIEIYTPEHKRVHGYYVFPFLLGDRLVARFDLKADRAASRLLVRSSWLETGPADEPPPRPAEVAAAAAVEFRRMARWLGLGAVEVADRGDLWPAVRTAVAAAGPPEPSAQHSEGPEPPPHVPEAPPELAEALPPEPLPGGAPARTSPAAP
ncbi:winged helix-turn-helix domain-containing protein [Nakamurella endophytica]|uniref:winged helix-turn-helix domain-containing protein n=1 Tax=Nakamurella endophytica TaxID=1748367 RepID=UPI001E479C76|nr:crosslink repair DNA glycosylase YcaQ family protein [Nakamurella endophytica]